MSIKIITLAATASLLMAGAAFAQVAQNPANHNTTRSNKIKPVEAPQDSSVDAAIADKLGDISGESQRSQASTGCVMFGGGADHNCDGVEDSTLATDDSSSQSNQNGAMAEDAIVDDDAMDDAGVTEATDYNSSRSNKSY